MRYSTAERRSKHSIENFIVFGLAMPLRMSLSLVLLFGFALRIDASPLAICGDGGGCSGSCSAGKECASVAGSCMCIAPPPPPPPPTQPCGPSNGVIWQHAESCSGSCPTGRYCAAVTGSCMCIERNSDDANSTAVWTGANSSSGAIVRDGINATTPEQDCVRCPGCEYCDPTNPKGSHKKKPCCCS